MKEELREVKEDDCELLFYWVNDCMVRENSFDSQEILYETHKLWFQNKLKAIDSLIYIYYIADTPIGQIRVDWRDRTGYIDYSIDSKYRGRGYGTRILEMIIELVVNKIENIDILIGKVKNGNIASKKAFEKAGFKKRSNDGFIEYYTLIR